MGSSSSKEEVRGRVSKEDDDMLKSGLEQPITPVGSEPPKKSDKKPSDEEHPSYTQAEMLETEENFKTIRKFLEKYHRALGDSNVEQFLKVLDGMKPLTDDMKKKFMDGFVGSEGLANQHLLSQQNILVLWERESLARYLKFKSEQNRLLVTESTFQTVAGQDKQREFFYSKYDQNQASPTDKEKENIAAKVSTTISFASDSKKDMGLQDALGMVKERKANLDKLVHVEALHYRAIRELLKINKSNIALIQYSKPSFDDTNSTN